MRHRLTTPLATLSALLLLTTPVFPQKMNSDIENIGKRDINKGNPGPTLSLEAEIALGRAASRELEQNVALIQDSVVTEYINRVGQMIVRNSDAKVPFAFRVVDSDEINLISLPGGFLFVNKGLILACDNEAELAGIIAHGVAQVAARHAVEQQQKASLVNIASIPSTVFGGGVPTAIMQQAAVIGVPLTFLAFRRTAVEEADWLGLQYMYKAGYDPTVMITFFQKLQAREKKKVSGLFATHPPTEDRIRQAQRNIATYLPAREQELITSADFQAVKARLLGRN